MLVLTRKVGEKIHIGDDVVITVLDVSRSRVRIGIDAPDDQRVMRGELIEFIDATRNDLREPEAVF